MLKKLLQIAAIAVIASISLTNAGMSQDQPQYPSCMNDLVNDLSSLPRIKQGFDESMKAYGQRDESCVCTCASEKNQPANCSQTSTQQEALLNCLGTKSFAFLLCVGDCARPASPASPDAAQTNGATQTPDAAQINDAQPSNKGY